LEFGVWNLEIKKEGKMQKKVLFYLLGLCLSLTGCTVRTYQMTRDRIDQDLTSGNRGYLKGQAPAVQGQERKATRTTQVVEVEIGSPVKLEKAPKQRAAAPIQKTEEESLQGNRGYIATPEIAIPAQPFEKYTVQKSDTLQKISKKFYGTTKRWMKIYNANQDVLKGPDKVYPGQVLKIPAEAIVKEPLMEPKENLK
jgi:LysM repeat protein